MPVPEPPSSSDPHKPALFMAVLREIAQSRREGDPLRFSLQWVREEPRRREAYSRQYVDRLSGEPARHTKLRLTRCVRSNRSG